MTDGEARQGEQGTEIGAVEATPQGRATSGFLTEAPPAPGTPANLPAGYERQPAAELKRYLVMLNVGVRATVRAESSQEAARLMQGIDVRAPIDRRSALLENLDLESVAIHVVRISTPVAPPQAEE